MRLTRREPEAIIPALVIPLFFFVVNTGALQSFAEKGVPGLDFKAFQLPVAIVFAVTGISRASSLVTDIQNGYFDRLLLTPVRRLTLLLGLMVADLVLVDDPDPARDRPRLRARRALRDRRARESSRSSPSPGSGASRSPASRTRSR